MRDPTTLNSQGPDFGPQYRSVIFYRSDAQKKDAEAKIAEVTKKGIWKDPIVTTVEPFKNFYVAEIPPRLLHQETRIKPTAKSSSRRKLKIFKKEIRHKSERVIF